MVSHKRKWIVSLALLTLLSACGGARNPFGIPYDPNQDHIYKPNPDTHGYDPNSPNSPTFSILKNVSLRVDPEISAFISHLEGALIPKRQGDPVIYDDMSSFVYDVYQGQLTIDNENISRLKNKYTFNYKDAPLKDISIQFLPGRIRMTGKMKKVVWIPFEMSGTAQPTPNGKILMMPDSIIAGGIPSKGLMDAIGLNTAKLISINGDRGVTLDGNNIILDPEQLFPPPKIKGNVVRLNIEQGKMTLFFGSQKRAPVRRPPDPRQSNYVHVYGGNVLIMNELHRGAELQMVDQNQGDPFDFYLGEYKRHLRAGYVKVMNDQGSLITLMPDYTQINNANTWNGYPGGPPPGVPQPGQPVAIPSPSPQIWGQSARKEYSGFTPATQYWNWN